MAEAPAIRRAGALRDQVYDLVRDRLRHGRIRPRQRLQEHQLATEFGVSRTPVREALARLVQDDLVRPDGRGFVVPDLDAADIDHIFELRRLIEPHAVGLSALAATPAGVAALQAAVADSRTADAEQRVGSFIEANARFRAAWLGLVGNPRLVRAVSLYDDHVQHLRVITLANPRVRAVVIAGLDSLAARIAGGDAPGAEAAMRDHLGEAEKAMRAAARPIAEGGR